MRFRVWCLMTILVWHKCNCSFNDWARMFHDWLRIVTEIFCERRVIEHARQQRHQCHDGGKDRNYTEKIADYGTQHSTTPNAVHCTVSVRRMAVQLDFS